MTSLSQSIHPNLAVGESGMQAAAQAVADFVKELQQGLDAHNAEISNHHFAGDVLWGGPFGATVSGYEPLHAIHLRLQREGRGGPSRYEIERVIAPAPGVAIAHVRRVALGHDDDKQLSFSEMALYVLVERGGTWWLAAGQNTPVRAGLSADGS